METGGARHPPAAPIGPHPAAAPPTAPPPPGKLVLVGVGHVFRIADEIRGALAHWQPDAVFVELDAGRFNALVQRRRTGKDPEGGTLVQRRLQALQRSIAQQFGTEAGDEMLAAVEGGRAVGAKVWLVDRSAQATLARVKRALTFREKMRAAGMVIGGLMRGIGRRSTVEKELAKYEEDPESALREIETKFPNLYRVLIAERDEGMATAIRKGLAGARLGVAIVGDGHVPGMARRLADLKPQVIRLREVRAGALPKGLVATGTTASVGFTVLGPATKDADKASAPHHNP